MERNKTNFLLFPGFRKKAVTLNYDDGVRQDTRLIDIMLKHGLKGTFNVNSGLFEKEYNGQTTGRMTVEELIKLYKESGMEVGVHGVKHLSLSHLDVSVACNEIASDRKELESLFGKVIKGMAYAYGTYTDETVQMLKVCGINYSRTTIATEQFNLPTDWLRLPTTCHHKNPKLMDLAKEFLQAEMNPYSVSSYPMWFLLWGHSYEFDRDDNWNKIEDFAELIGGKDDIWYATTGEVFDYVRDYNRLEFSIDGSMVHNPSAQPIYYNNFGKFFEIKPGETVYIEKRSFL